MEVLEVSRRVLELEVEQESLEREDSPDPDACDNGDVDSDAGYHINSSSLSISLCFSLFFSLFVLVGRGNYLISH